MNVLCEALLWHKINEILKKVFSVSKPADEYNYIVVFSFSAFLVRYVYRLAFVLPFIFLSLFSLWYLFIIVWHLKHTSKPLTLYFLQFAIYTEILLPYALIQLSVKIFIQKSTHVFNSSTRLEIRILGHPTCQLLSLLT